MEGQKRQDTERTNDVGDGWMNLGSLLLGLTAWGLSLIHIYTPCSLFSKKALVPFSRVSNGGRTDVRPPLALPFP